MDFWTCLIIIYISQAILFKIVSLLLKIIAIDKQIINISTSLPPQYQIFSALLISRNKSKFPSEVFLSGYSPKCLCKNLEDLPL